ncbi:cytochrome P450 family protein [Paraburkholderia xenovorans LB400]|uniref:Cytochrome P450 n=1 Tax=Paraburkholderia xenovorans (strain LB400) TaxID=266265 RepID=Q13I76_PARXL|nr:cytochrome P450 [Paraburkholderia xenovorans]ABE36213.1 Putative cytochrome P450 [Paraburkholderia xenovorans LB400]AIP34963.1 cytochrome P450 family protein [Paraburkholderia xenovorans LB400]
MTFIYDPNDPDVRRDPHAVFRKLRETEPVHWSPKLSGWVVTSYELASEVLTTNGTYSAERFTAVQQHLSEEKRVTAAEVMRWFQHWMVFRDPPDHTRLRRHMANTLNIPVFDARRETVISVVNELLDRIPVGDAFDFFQAFSLWMPGIVVADLLGVERDRLLEVKQWSDDMMTFIGSARGVPDKYERARRGANGMGTYFLDLIAKRRAEPREDALSRLIASEVEGQRLSDDELVGCMMMVLNGGHETTANLLNNSMLALAAHPQTVQHLRQHPDEMAAAVEEFLRYDSPVLSIGRIVTEDTELGDQEIAAGDRVFAMLVGANRDPEVFSDPDELRTSRNPNPHMAFGKGPHFCLGTPLARLEGQIALTAILERFSSIELCEPVESIPWLNSLVTHGPTRLPLRLK